MDMAVAWMDVLRCVSVVCVCVCVFVCEWLVFRWYWLDERWTTESQNSALRCAESDELLWAMSRGQKNVLCSQVGIFAGMPFFQVLYLGAGWKIGIFAYEISMNFSYLSTKFRFAKFLRDVLANRVQLH